MRSFHRIVLIGAAFCLGSTGLFVQAQKQDGLVEQIARLPWDRSNVVIHLSVKDDSRIVVVAHYVNPYVVTDTDTGYISIHSYKFIFGKNGVPTGGFVEGSEMHSSYRDGINSWCDGEGNFENANKNGFDYHLDLTWQIGKGFKTTFNETFHCRWVKEQTFKKGGFTITITVKLK